MLIKQPMQRGLVVAGNAEMLSVSLCYQIWSKQAGQQSPLSPASICAALKSIRRPVKAVSASPRVSGFMTQWGLSDFDNITFSAVHVTGF